MVEGMGVWKWLNDLPKVLPKWFVLAHNIVKSNNCNLGPVHHSRICWSYEDRVKELLKPFCGQRKQK